jgi:hypothetical protein
MINEIYCGRCQKPTINKGDYIYIPLKKNGIMVRSTCGTCEYIKDSILKGNPDKIKIERPNRKPKTTSFLT